MPAVTQTETIDVRAPAHIAYDVVAGDLLRVSGSPDSLISRRPFDEGPLQPGFRFEATVVHNRKLCLSAQEITAIEAGRMLEQSINHYCADAERTTHAGERWKFDERPDGSTVVTLSFSRPGRWLQKLLAKDDVTRTSLRKRLESCSSRPSAASAGERPTAPARGRAAPRRPRRAPRRCCAG